MNFHWWLLVIGVSNSVNKPNLKCLELINSTVIQTELYLLLLCEKCEPEFVALDSGHL